MDIKPHAGIRHRSDIATTALALCMACAGAHASDIPPYTEVPAIYTQSPAVFTDLFSRAFASTKRALLLGDSQETCPTGRGDVYIPRFNWEFWRRYGNAPETPWVTMRSSFGGGDPWGQWLVRGATAAPNVTETRIEPQRLPPGFRACKTSTRGGPNVNDNQIFGQLLVLQQDAASVNPETDLVGRALYFDTSQPIYLDVMAATNQQSGEVSVRVEPNTASFPNFYATPVATLVTAMGLESPTPGVLVQRLGPLNLNGLPFMQVEIAGNSPFKFTDIIAARFAIGAPGAGARGLTVTPIADGGYRADTIQSVQDECGPVLLAMGPDLVFLSYGANEAGLSRTPEQYQEGVESLIGWLRFNISPDLPVVLLCDPARAGLTPPQQENFARYAGANLRIAQSDPLVCAVNSRLLTEQQGWTTAACATFSPDGVHFSALGAITKARVEVDALMREFTSTRLELDFLGGGGGVSTGNLLKLTGIAGQMAIGASSGPTLRIESGLLYESDLAHCPADFDGDGTVDFFDYDAFVICFEGGACPPAKTADFDGDGALDFFDYDAFVVAFEAPCDPP